MGPYIFIAVILFLIMVTHNKTSILSLIIVAAIAGLRYQVGADWLGYDEFFRNIGSLSDYIEAGTLGVTQQFEPYYVLLNILFKSIRAKFSVMFGIISVFNLYVIYRVARRICPASVSFVIFLYFCIALLPIQFNIIRQSLASSFVLIGLIYLLNGSRLAGLIIGANAIGLHASSIMFVPLFFLTMCRPKNIIIYTVCVAATAMFFISAGTIETVSKFVQALNIPFIGDKFVFYDNVEAAKVSFGALLFLIGNVFLLLVFVKKTSCGEGIDRKLDVEIAIWLTLYMVVSLLVFSAFPSIWNRIMAVALPWQLATFFRVWVVSDMSFERRSLAKCAAGIGGIFILIYELTRPDAGEMFQYHSLIQVVAGDEGEGRLRTMIVQQEIEERTAAKAFSW